MDRKRYGGVDLLRPLPQRTVGTGPGDRWTVTGTTTNTIVVDAPTRLQVISSPVSGRAHIGSGYVTGGGDQPRPFAGQISFTQTAGRTGWLLFTELSAANGAVIRAASVLVGFAGKPQPPDVKNVSWTPVLPIVNGWLKLPPGAGTETFAVWASATDRVEFFLTPTGTATDPPANGTVAAWSWSRSTSTTTEPTCEGGDSRIATFAGAHSGSLGSVSTVESSVAAGCFAEPGRCVAR